MKYQLDFYQFLQDLYQIDSWQLDQAGQVNSSTSHFITATALSSLLTNSFGQLNSAKLDLPVTPLIVEARCQLIWIICQQKAGFLLFGPLLINEQSRQLYLNQVQKSQCQAELKQAWQSQIIKLPIIPINQVFELARIINTAIYHQQKSISDFQIIDLASHDQSSRQVQNYQESRKYHKDAWAAEQQVFDCVKKGDFHYAQHLNWASRVSSGVQLPTAGPHQRDQINFFTLNFIVSRAAIAGGLAPSIAYNLTDQYNSRCLTVKTTFALQQLADKMVSDFVLRVHNVRAKSSNLTPQIRACQDYIDLNFTQQIDLEKLAKISGYSTWYLCHQFKEQTGMTIKQYVNHQRLTQAKRLLSASQKNLTTIAEELGYSSRNYFSRCFQKEFGCRPMAYRKKFMAY